MDLKWLLWSLRLIFLDSYKFGYLGWRGKDTDFTFTYLFLPVTQSQGCFGMALETRKAHDGGQNISSCFSTFGIAWPSSSHVFFSSRASFAFKEQSLWLFIKYVEINSGMIGKGLQIWASHYLSSKADVYLHLKHRNVHKEPPFLL